MNRSMRIPLLGAALLLAALTLSSCKGQYPAVLLTISTAPGNSFRIPTDADGLRLDVYDDANNQLIITKGFTLQAGTNFPYTVTLVETGSEHAKIKINATVTLQGAQVGTGSIDNVAMSDGSTATAAISITQH